MTPPRIEETRQSVTVAIPIALAKPSNCHELFFIGWKPRLHPIVHNQQEIRPVLHSSQVPGIGQVVANVERHPQTLHQSIPRLAKYASRTAACSRRSSAS